MSPQTGPTDPDVPSLEVLYERHAARVLNVIHRMTGDPDVARDLAQDVWIQVYRNLDRFEARADFFTWIYRIAVNRTLNYLKQAKRRKQTDVAPRAAGAESGDDPVASIPAPDEGADRALERQQLARHLWDAIQSLDPKYRVPIILFHYEEQTYQQIADTLGLSLTAVQARIFRARKQLAARLGPLLDQL